MEPLAAFLAKAKGQAILKAVDALGRLGLPKAVDVLVQNLSNDATKPFWGEVCQGVARGGHVASIDRLVEIGRRVGAPARHAEGCRSGIAALKTRQNPGELLINIGAKRVKGAKALVFAHRPGLLKMMMVERDATCDAPGDLGIEFELPLGRNGKPVTGQPQVPTLSQGDADLGRGPIYFFRVDALELVDGAGIKGVVFATHASSGKPRVVVSGAFSGQFCAPK
ncbi:MAG: hypothetical protein ACI9OJ_002249 [Myxococcota bacterium]